MFYIEFKKSTFRIKNATNTRYSKALSHPSTNLAQPRLSSVIRREREFSWQYGRQREQVWLYADLSNTSNVEKLLICSKTTFFAIFIPLRSGLAQIVYWYYSKQRFQLTTRFSTLKTLTILLQDHFCSSLARCFRETWTQYITLLMNKTCLS